MVNELGVVGLVLDIAGAVVLGSALVRDRATDYLPEIETDRPTLRPGGVLVENSPFVVDSSNPMHHDDFGFETFMRERGFVVTAEDGDGTRVWSLR